jgi:iron complex transport system ATP-binding protein
VTIVSVTHDINAAALHSDHVVALKSGQVVFAGGPDDLMTPDILGRIYDTEFLLIPHPHAERYMVVPDGRAR